jgi:hypothetical protein
MYFFLLPRQPSDSVRSSLLPCGFQEKYSLPAQSLFKVFQNKIYCEDDCLLGCYPVKFVEIARPFRGAYSLRHQIHRRLHDGDSYAPLKRRLVSTKLHDATSQKTGIFKLKTEFIGLIKN